MMSPSGSIESLPKNNSWLLNGPISKSDSTSVPGQRPHLNGLRLNFSNSDFCDKLNNIILTESESETNIHSDNDIDEDVTNNMLPKLEKASSLKSTYQLDRHEQDTPKMKKIVRFADTLGLDLTDIHIYFDEIPNITPSAFATTNRNIKPENIPVVRKVSIPQKMLIALFQQPGASSEFLQSVLQQNVMLESAIVNDPICLSVQGIARVRNLSYNKSVYVRYTFNSWQTVSDLKCSYLSESGDGLTDKFTFVIYGHSLVPGQKLEFAIRFECDKGHYWDSNRGNNYVFQCLPSSPTSSNYSSITTSEDKWIGGAFY